MLNMTGKLRTGIAVAVLITAVPVLAQTTKEQGAGSTVGGATNSGPGVQGPPDTRTGPSTKGSNGASAGDAATENSTTPSQDSSGVKGMPGNKSGPAAKGPSSDGKPSAH